MEKTLFAAKMKKLRSIGSRRKDASSHQRLGTHRASTKKSMRLKAFAPKMFPAPTLAQGRPVEVLKAGSRRYPSSLAKFRSSPRYHRNRPSRSCMQLANICPDNNPLSTTQQLLLNRSELLSCDDVTRNGEDGYMKKQLISSRSQISQRGRQKRSKSKIIKNALTQPYEYWFRRQIRSRLWRT